MGCLSVILTPYAPQPVLTLTDLSAHPNLTLHDGQGNPPRKTTSLTLSPTPRPTLTLTPGSRPTITITPGPRASLIVAEVCSVSSGEILVLAGTDGPLRFKDGGYWLLDPAREQSDDSDLIDMSGT